MIEGTDALTGIFAERYTIDREIGRGASAIVYLARDERTGQAVAIKVLRQVLLESIGASQFLREIRHHQRLSHPRILPVLDSGSADGRLFIVLPYLDGGTLRAKLERERQLPYVDAIRIAQAIADALAHAHEAGLVHRDIKPENILFSEGQAHLGDFGIARALERATGDRTTSTGIVRGTPAYMSPEQAAGQAEYDGRSDIYSLGCVLYEMIAGVQAFVGPTPQSVIAQRLSSRPAPIAKFRDSVPRSLEVAVSRAMMLAPADRFQTAREFAAALERAATDAQNHPSRSSARRRAFYRGTAFIGGSAAIAAVAAAIALGRAPKSDPHSIPEGDPRRIAVLYLDALTPDVLPRHVADGITEDLIDRLGSVRAFHVISPNGVRSFRDRAAPIDSISRVLKVGTIVSGSVARSGDALRINVRLVDAASGRQLDSRMLDEQWTELFTLQDKLAEQVQFWLRQRLGDEIALRAQRAATKSVAAWEAVQMASADTRRAVEAAMSRNDTSSAQLFLRADSSYVRAAELDPSWIHPIIKRGQLALLGLAPQSPVPPQPADSLLYRAMAPQERSVLWTRRALELAEEALRRSPQEALALDLRGEAQLALLTTGLPGRDSVAALADRDLRAAVVERPDLASAWSALAELSVQRGRFADAAAAAQRAFEADAFFELRRVLAVAFSAALHAELFDDARKWCTLGLARYPGDPRFTECNLRLLGWTGQSRADVAAAWRMVNQIEAGDTLRMLAATWGYRRLMAAAILARSGLADSALAVLRTVQNQASELSKRSSALAEIYVLLLLGERNQALARLRQHLLTAPESRDLLARHPWFRTLQRDPRFEALVRPAE